MIRMVERERRQTDRKGKGRGETKCRKYKESGKKGIHARKGQREDIKTNRETIR